MPTRGNILIGISDVVAHPSQRPLSTARTIHRGGTHAEIRNRHRRQELAAIFLLWLIGATLMWIWRGLAVHLLLVHDRLLIGGILHVHAGLLVLVVHTIRLLLVRGPLIWFLLVGHRRRLQRCWCIIGVDAVHLRLRR